MDKKVKHKVLKQIRDNISESEIKRSIKDYLQYLENQGKLMYIPNNSLNVPTKNGHYVRTGKKGSPDLILWLPIHSHINLFRFYEEALKLVWLKSIALEVKTATGKQSKAQKEWQEKFEKLGGKYYIVRSLEDVKKIIDNAE